PLESTLFPYTTLFRSSLAGLSLIGGSGIADVGVVLVWGLATGGLGPAIQVRMMRQAGSRHRTTAGTLMPVAMNLGIAAGSALGRDRKSTRLNSSHVSI